MCMDVHWLLITIASYLFIIFKSPKVCHSNITTTGSMFMTFCDCSLCSPHMQEFKHLWMEVCSWITSVSFHHLNRKQFCDFSSAMGAALGTALGNWILKWLCRLTSPECNVWCLPNSISHLACHIYVSHWPLTSFQFDNLSCSSQIIPLGPYAECSSDNYSAGSSRFWRSIWFT